MYCGFAARACVCLLDCRNLPAKSNSNQCSLAGRKPAVGTAPQPTHWGSFIFVVSLKYFRRCCTALAGLPVAPRRLRCTPQATCLSKPTGLLRIVHNLNPLTLTFVYQQPQSVSSTAAVTCAVLSVTPVHRWLYNSRVTRLFTVCYAHKAATARRS
jgi:hypothetical protein